MSDEFEVTYVITQADLRRIDASYRRMSPDQIRERYEFARRFGLRHLIAVPGVKS